MDWDSSRLDWIRSGRRRTRYLASSAIRRSRPNFSGACTMKFSSAIRAVRGNAEETEDSPTR
jgi:hypothetical protein